MCLLVRLAKPQSAMLLLLGLLDLWVQPARLGLPEPLALLVQLVLRPQLLLAQPLLARQVLLHRLRIAAHRLLRCLISRFRKALPVRLEQQAQLVQLALKVQLAPLGQLALLALLEPQQLLQQERQQLALPVLLQA
jgi:hypothetical protein